jgi:hypothetical protein
MSGQITNIDPDDLHRGVKMALDSGEASTLDEAYAIFSAYRVTLCVGPEVLSSRAHQAAVLSLVNAGRRSFLGGIEVYGALDTTLLVPSFVEGNTLGEAVIALGGVRVDAVSGEAPIVLIGSVVPSVPAPLVLRLTFNAWAGGVAPHEDGIMLAEHGSDVLGAILASAMALSEVFQWLRGNGHAGRRSSGLSLWSPRSDWTGDTSAPLLTIAPSRVWVLGLGHLGQAFLWIYGLLTAGGLEAPRVLLHDFDRLTTANESTSLLTTRAMRGAFKTRAVAERLEATGMKTLIVERPFNGFEHVGDEHDPRILFCGVDNGRTRALVENAGFDLIVEAGLGNGLSEYHTMRLHTFPASRRAERIWEDEEGKEAQIDARAYRSLKEAGMEACGVLQLASRSVGVPFVGVVAAALSLAEMIRTLMGCHRHEVIDLSLRDPTLLEAVRLSNNTIDNLGYIQLKAS